MPTKKYKTIKKYGSKKKGTKSRGMLGGRPKKKLNASVQPEPTPQLTIEPCPSMSNAPDPIPGTLPSTSIASLEKISAFHDLTMKLYNKNLDPRPISVEGFRLIDLGNLSDLITQLACPQCLELKLSLEEGAGGNLKIYCTKCKDLVATKSISKPALNSKISETNIRLITAGRSCGIGYEKMVKFWGILNTPIPMHLKTHQSLAKKLHHAALQVASEIKTEAVNILKSKFYPNHISNDPLSITVTYDGTWHKRGHSSHFGVGVVIDLNSGFVLDTEVISNYCHGCKIGPSKDDERFKDWLENHKSNCQKNFGGSSNAMEVEAAKILFSRSVASHNLMYTTMLCDGDSKAFNAVKELNLYESEITKEDCINHVAKRMFHALDTLKKTTPGIGGRGKLTKEAMEKMTRSYASQLKKTAPDVDKMKTGVYAGFFHMCSTDAEPHHTFCPSAVDSWCHYNRHHARLAAGLKSQSKKHTPILPKNIAELILPVYDRLTNKDLLSRCSRMKTQNCNECFNGMIWQRCPKIEFASRMTVETAVALSTIEFNCGPKGLDRVMKLMGVSAGKYFEAVADRAVKRRITKAKRASSEVARKRRKTLKLNKAKKADTLEHEEGLTYVPGAFNV